MTSGSLSNLSHCIVDMSIPSSTNPSTHFSGLTIRNVKDCLLITGKVTGPAHITAASESVIVTNCRQLRMHECRNVDVYLHCSSRPIIEDCEGIRFAPIPMLYQFSSADTAAGVPKPLENQWDKVDDFNWLKAEHSPHWCVLPEEERVKDEIWKGVVPGGPGIGLDDILLAVKGKAVA